MHTIEFNKTNRYILYDADCIENPELLRFEVDYWASQSAIMGFAEGRGTTFFIQVGDSDYVLRHYRRGGMVARISPDRYIWTGLQRTRAWREWQLLAQMQQMGLPVPQPVAVQVVRHGMFYSADIMTRRINQANTLSDELGRHTLGREIWQALGKTIRRFHFHGIWHADLNANNILLNDDKQLFFIDFDRGRIRQPAHQWQQANLDRLKRSLLKLQSRSNSFYFTEPDWQALIDGYSDEVVD